MKLLIALVISALCILNIGAFELYNPNENFCCTNKLFPFDKEQNKIIMCCGSSIFDPRQELCCDSKVMKLPEEAAHTDIPPPVQAGSFRSPHLFYGPTYACCGEAIYNIEKEICCDGKVTKKPEVAPDSPYPSFFACCGSDMFNVSAQDCCAGKIKDKTSSSEGCCGDQLVNYEEQICCMDGFETQNITSKIFPRDDLNAGCCGLQKLNYKKEACCGNKVIPLPENPQESTSSMCCGDSLHQFTENEMCCDGKIMPRKSFDELCCGTDMYNTNDQICCDGHLFPLYSNSTYCCGAKAYDEHKETCCFKNMEIVPLGTDLGKLACCD